MRSASQQSRTLVLAPIYVNSGCFASDGLAEFRSSSRHLHTDCCRTPRHHSYFLLLRHFADHIPCRCGTSMFPSSSTAIVRFGHFAGEFRNGEFGRLAGKSGEARNGVYARATEQLCLSDSATLVRSL